jgi:hypothetical protein
VAGGAGCPWRGGGRGGLPLARRRAGWWVRRWITEFSCLQFRYEIKESEKRLAAESPTSCVFNWVASWRGGLFVTKSHDFGEGLQVSCFINLDHSKCSAGYHLTTRPDASPHVQGLYMMAIEISLLTPQDKIFCSIYQAGTTAQPIQVYTQPDVVRAAAFTPTQERMAGTVRWGRAFRLRAVVHIFPRRP